MDKFFEFRKKHPIFLYKNYHITENIDSIDIVYDFEIPELAEFHPSWSFVKPKNCSIKNDLTFERIAFSLGMVEAVSYWKSVCSPEMRVECGELDTEQIKWWKKLYFMGLGEFFYINHIQTDMENFMNISCNGSFKNTVEKSNAPIGCLVPIGGGKDSALTIETLKNAGIKCKCYSINKRVSVRDTVLTAGLNESDLIYSRRNFDRSLIKLNEKGYLNGHTPFSAIVAFSAEITAYLNDLKYIVLSNEASANETTVIDSDVNHQYSKSFEFENDFHNYESRFLKTNIYYFSFLRPLSELQIAKMFAAHKKYLPVFRSCNLGSKVSPDIWCAECPKCLFVSLILSPFVTSQELTDIFGKNLIDDEDMIDYFTELIGKSEHKPFECVGSIDEVNLAVQMTIKKYLKEKTPIPLLLEKYMEMGLYSPDGIDEKAEEYMSKYNDVNLLPEKFELILKEEMERIL